MSTPSNDKPKETKINFGFNVVFGMQKISRERESNFIPLELILPPLESTLSSTALTALMRMSTLVSSVYNFPLLTIVLVQFQKKY